jgi:uncharacterized membrane protein YfbV (UPF0208 family)
MATITITAVATGFTPPSKVLTMTDAVMSDMIAAYQTDANVWINGTATPTQVLNYITTLWHEDIKVKIQQYKTTPAVIPPPPIIVSNA